jgi:hypothetical protein
MAHLTLNCPTCRKQLVYVPLDGLTLHYRCDEHGAVILKPLMLMTSEEQFELPARLAHRHTHDAA